MKRCCLFLAELAIFWFAFTPPASAALTNRYVVKGNPSAMPPYDTPANAAGDIQTAINYAYTVAGETVLVYAATYDAGWAIAGSMTNRVYISKAITVRSISNDPAGAIIKGAWDPATNGPAAVRCVYMVGNAALVGFTLTNGATLSGGNGGGVYAESSTASISNCVIACCSAGSSGGGAYQGTLSGCTLLSNKASNGAGAYSCTVSNCTIMFNESFNDINGMGGGVHGGNVYNSTIISNKAILGGGARAANLFNSTISYNYCKWAPGNLGHGGGTYQGMASNCVIAYNGVAMSGAGVIHSTLYNCLIYGNVAGYYGGGVSGGSINMFNCTVVGNYAYTGGGVGLESAGPGYVYNCIIYSNSAYVAVGQDWVSYGGGVMSFANSCTFATNQTGYSGSGNTTNNPLFMAFGAGYGLAHVPGNYRLRVASPCLNSGTNQAWMPNAADLDGRPRLRYGTVDMGAYETIYRGAIFKFR